MKHFAQSRWPVLRRRRLAVIAACAVAGGASLANGLIGEAIKRTFDGTILTGTNASGSSSAIPSLEVSDLRFPIGKQYELKGTFGDYEPDSTDEFGTYPISTVEFGRGVVPSAKFKERYFKTKCGQPTPEAIVDDIVYEYRNPLSEEEIASNNYVVEKLSQREKMKRNKSAIEYWKELRIGQDHWKIVDKYGGEGVLVYWRILAASMLADKRFLYSGVISKVQSGQSASDLLAPAAEVVVRNPANVPQLVIGVKPKTLGWSGGSVCGGAGGGEIAFSLPETAAISIDVGVSDEEDPYKIVDPMVRFQSPVVIPAHGYGRFKVWLKSPVGIGCDEIQATIAQIEIIGENSRKSTTEPVCVTNLLTDVS